MVTPSSLDGLYIYIYFMEDPIKKDGLGGPLGVPPF